VGTLGNSRCLFLDNDVRCPFSYSLAGLFPRQIQSIKKFADLPGKPRVLASKLPTLVAIPTAFYRLGKLLSYFWKKGWLVGTVGIETSIRSRTQFR
jgi:hypothetical protein